MKKSYQGQSERVRIETVEFDTSEELISSLLMQPGNYVMYRGQPDKDWPRSLVPSFHRLVDDYLPNTDRSERTRREAIYCSDFVDHWNALKDEKNQSFDWLGTQFMMQHYGAPSRLLDWTYSPFIALYFACRDYCDNSSCSPGVIWGMSAFELNFPRTPNPLDIERVRVHTISEKTPRLVMPTDWFDQARRIAEGMIDRGESWPFAVHPPFFDQRMVAQRAAFTFHAEAPASPIEWVAPEYVWRNNDWQHERDSFHERRQLTVSRLIIPSEWKFGALKALACMNITESTLFPGTDGLGRAMKYSLISGDGLVNSVGTTYEN